MHKRLVLAREHAVICLGHLALAGEKRSDEARLIHMVCEMLAERTGVREACYSAYVTPESVAENLKALARDPDCDPDLGHEALMLARDLVRP